MPGVYQTGSTPPPLVQFQVLYLLRHRTTAAASATKFWTLIHRDKKCGLCSSLKWMLLVMFHPTINISSIFSCSYINAKPSSASSSIKSNKTPRLLTVSDIHPYESLNTSGGVTGTLHPSCTKIQLSCA
jgi:hypothetical protein